MNSRDEPQYDDRLLVSYLLGALSREETERLDELSITDDDFVSRLNAAENELVDAYVRNELTAGDQEKFASAYLHSPRRRQKVEFARTLFAFKPPTAKRVQEIEVVAPSEPVAPAVPTRSRKLFSLGWAPRLAFVGITLALLLAGGYLLRENLALRNGMSGAQTQQDSLQQHQQQLEQELNEQHAANVDMKKQLEQAQASHPDLNQLKTVALLLPPPTRGAARIPELAVRTGTDIAVLMLTLESGDFPAYRAALKDPATNKVLWQSESLATIPAAGGKKAISISFPAAPLKQQNYVVELTGEPAHGRAEILGAYPFRVVLK